MSTTAGPLRIAFASAADGPAIVPLLTALYRHDVPEAPPPAPDTVIAHAACLLDRQPRIASSSLGRQTAPLSALPRSRS